MARTLIGTVASAKPDKTIIVNVQARVTHPIYRKQYTVSRRFAAHDEQSQAQPGDRVAIVETKPMSASKRFRLLEILERPELQADKLAVTKTEDTGRRASKANVQAKENESTVQAEKIKAAKGSKQ